MLGRVLESTITNNPVKEGWGACGGVRNEIFDLLVLKLLKRQGSSDIDERELWFF
jgi:hypothetical protein